MCVIAVKPKGIDMPTEEVLQQMWDSNKDGAGFMYNEDGRVQIRKGFMTFEDFKRNLQNAYDDLTRKAINLKEDVAFVYHFRIATHGTVIPQNTHPFPVSDNLDALKALDVSTTLGMAHNGIIRTLDDDKENNLTDTATFVKDVVVPFQRYFTNAFLKMANITRFIGNTINASRLAFLDGEGNVTKIGSWSDGACNLSYSNKNHVPYTPTHKTTGKSTALYDDDYSEYLQYLRPAPSKTQNKIPSCTVREVDLTMYDLEITNKKGVSNSYVMKSAETPSYFKSRNYYLTHDSSILIESFTDVKFWSVYTVLNIYFMGEFQITLKGNPSSPVSYGDLSLMESGTAYAVDGFKTDVYVPKTQFDVSKSDKKTLVLKKVPHKGHSFSDSYTGVYIPDFVRNSVYMDADSNVYVQCEESYLYKVKGGVVMDDSKPLESSMTEYKDLKHIGADGNRYDVVSKVHRGVVVYE